jgi:hypothetical protein
MPLYRATFFKDLLSSQGHQFKCPQGSVEIRRGRSVDRAVQAAEHWFARRRLSADWKLDADYFELEADGRRVDYCPHK